MTEFVNPFASGAKLPGDTFVNPFAPGYVPPRERGAGSEILTGLKRGALVDLPAMTGQALKYASSPGNALYEAGQGMVNSAEDRGTRYNLTLQPENNNPVTNALATGASMLPAIAAPAALAAGALAAAPTLPVLASTGVVAGAMATPFAMSAGQDTLEKGEKAGLTQDKALETARLNAGWTFGSQLALGFVGAQLLGRGSQALGKMVSKEAAPLAEQTMAAMTGRAGVIKPFLKQLPLTTAEAVGVGAAQMAGSAAIEGNAGIAGPSAGEAALESIPGMLGLTAVLAPLGLAGRAVRASSLNARATMLESSKTSAEMRDVLADQYFKELNKVDPAAAAEFRSNANTAIQNNLGIQVDKGLFLKDAVLAPEPPPAAPAAPRVVLPADAERERVNQLVRLAKDKADTMDLAPKDPVVADNIIDAQQYLRDQALAKAAGVERAVDANATAQKLADAGVTPTQALTFAEFRKAEKQRASDAGESAPVAKDFQTRWEQHKADVVAENARLLAEVENPVSRNEPGRVLSDPTNEQVRPLSVMEIAMEEARKKKETDLAYAAVEEGQAASKAAEMDAIANRTKAAELAAAAEAGTVPDAAKLVAATPERLTAELVALNTAENITNKGMTTKIGREVAAAIEGKQTLEDQIAAVRELRDAKKETSVSRELLDKLLVKLSPEPEVTPVAVAEAARVAEPVKPQEPVAVAEAARVAEPTPKPADPRAQLAEAVVAAPKNIAESATQAAEGAPIVVPRAEGARTSGGRPEGTPDARRTLAAPTKGDDLIPYTRTLEEWTRNGVDSLAAKSWWQDLATAIRNPDTVYGKEMLENGKFTDEQASRAVEMAARFDAQDKLYEQMRIKRDEALRKSILEDAQPEKAKSLFRRAELENIFGGDSGSLTLDRKGSEKAGEAAVRQAVILEADLAKLEDEGKPLPKEAQVSGVLDALQKTTTDPQLKQLIAKLQSLELSTTISRLAGVIKGNEDIVGAYLPNADHIAVTERGATTVTVLHEVTHAATTARLDRAIALVSERDSGQRRAFSPEERVLMNSLDSLASLFLDAKKRADARGETHYGLKDIGEFVAEAFANKDFQTFLNSGDQTPWKRFKEFVRGILGLRVNETTLDKVLAATDPLLSNERAQMKDDTPSLARFERSPDMALRQTEDMLGRAVKMVEGFASDGKRAVNEQHLAWTSLNHIKEWFKDVLPSAHADALPAYVRAVDKKGAMIAERNRETGHVYNAMRSLEAKTKTTLYTLMGEATRLGIDPSKPFKSQPNLDPSDLRSYNQLKQMYDSPGVAAVFDRAAAHTKKDFERELATVVYGKGWLSGYDEKLLAKIDPTKGYTPEIKAMLDWLIKNPDPDIAADAKATLAFSAQKLAGPYFHLGRSGDLFVRAQIKDNPEARAAAENAFQVTGLTDTRTIRADDLRFFARFEKVGEQKAVADALSRLAEAGHLEPGWESGRLQMKLAALDSTAPSFVRNMIQRIGIDERLTPEAKSQFADTIRRLYVEMMPETSTSKILAKRKNGGVAGFDSDMGFNFEKRAFQSAFYVANNAIRPEITRAERMFTEGVNALSREGPAGANFKDNAKALTAGNVLAELRQRQASAIAEVNYPKIDALSSLGHSFYLAGNPAFILTNMLQPLQLALPVIGGRHGFVSTSKQMFRSSKDAWGIIKDTIGEGWTAEGWRGAIDADISIDKSNLSTGEKDALRAAVASGQIEWTQGHMAAGEPGVATTATKVASSLTHYSEAANRISTMLTAYNLEKRRSGSTHQKAVDYALQTVKDTQFDYSPQNTARMLSKTGFLGPVTPLVTQFMRFATQTMELLGRLSLDATKNESPKARAEARKALAGVLGTTTMLAGTLGLPAAGIVAVVYNNIFGSQDSPVDMVADYRNWLADTFGQEAGQIIARGVVNPLGADLSSRVSLADIVPFTRFLSDRRKVQDQLSDGALQALGPVVGAGAGMYLGAAEIANGNILKGMAMGLPAVVRGPIKAIELAQNDFVDAKGNRMSSIEASPWDIALQAANFTPTKKSERGEAQRSVNTLVQLTKTRAQKLRDKYAKAVEQGDLNAINDLMPDIQAFNIANPDLAISDLGSIIRQRAVTRSVEEEAGVSGKARQLPRLEAAGRFANPKGMP